LRAWRNWQTRKTKDLVTAFGRGSSSLLVRTKRKELVYPVPFFVSPGVFLLKST
jgi:hypothetical protein